MSFATSGIYPNGSYDIVEGFKTAKERFSIGNRVRVSGGYSRDFGFIVAFSDEFPYKACVRLDNGRGDDTGTTCWIKTDNLTFSSYK